MASSFGGIYQAAGALNAARYGLEITGQNIANASTPGYTRQRADLAAVGGAVGVPAIHTGYLDEGGVRVVGASRLSDQVLEIRARSEHARNAAADTTATRMSDLEDIFREPSEAGLAAKLDTYWAAWGDVANDPGAQVPREMLINAATAATVTLHSMDSALDNVASTSFNSLEASVTRANTAAVELSELNRRIVTGKASGVNINNLLDRRDALLDIMARTVGATATLKENGTAEVVLGGVTLVTDIAQGHTSVATPIEIVPASGTGTADFNDFALEAGGAAVTLGESQAKAEFTVLTVTIPDYRAKLDLVASNLADTTNAIQSAGFDKAGTAGIAMFDDGAGQIAPTGPGDPHPVTARNISVASGFGWEQVAAASPDPGNPATSGGPLDGGNALAAALSAAAPTSPDSAYKSLIGKLGLESSSAQQLQITQASITASVDTLKQQSAGVSFDEEISNMLTYQMAYQASSRVLTTLDTMLDTLINRTGLVGRA